MIRFLLAAALVVALPVLAFAQGAGLPYVAPSSASTRIGISASSGNVAAGAATATLSGIKGKVTHICGFSITSSGATAASVVSPTVTGANGGTLTFTYPSVAGAAAGNAALVVPLYPCVPATGENQSIAVSLPSLGAGNTNATVNAWGFQY
jgi:hypothetical protein